MHCTICTICTIGDESAESAKQKIECDRLTVWKQKLSQGQKGQGIFYHEKSKNCEKITEILTFLKILMQKKYLILKK